MCSRTKSAPAATKPSKLPPSADFVSNAVIDKQKNYFAKTAASKSETQKR